MIDTPVVAREDESGPFRGFEDLMPYRVQDILLVSSLYDAFTLQEDGRLNELVMTEFIDLDTHHTPRITHVSSGAEAVRLAREERRFNLIITAISPGDMDATRLARELATAGLDVPVVVLAYDHRELSNFITRADTSRIERCFLWQGDAHILLAVVNYVEDQRNVAHDTASTGVRVVLLVENSIRHYSSVLPTLYSEIIRQSASALGEGSNLSHKLVRLRARPKILLCTSYEEAWQRWTTYHEHVLGIISDVDFPRGGQPARDAGFVLARAVRADAPDVPILLQSSRGEHAVRAAAEGLPFVLKGSPTMLHDLHRFMVERFSFGDFVFRLPDGREVGRASDLRGLEDQLAAVPAESVAYHGERNDFSTWLAARAEFALAHRLRPRRVSDFSTLEQLRAALIDSIAEYRREQAQSLVGDFDRDAFDASEPFFARIGGGSIGGKARGLAFVRRLLGLHHVHRFFPGVQVNVPPAVVLGTDVFDRFLADNELLDFALKAADDEAIVHRFLHAELPADVLADLSAFLAQVRWPLAVRSSSLLEDSQYQPFTGVYDTLMLPNRHADPRVRLERLVAAVKRVYASTFLHHSKAFFRATPYRLEEEKMAVILQKVVGAAHGPRFYPDFAGVARSRNFYPVAPLVSEDGVAAVALGLGRSVVEGERVLTFCPRAPRHPIEFSSVKDIIANSQRQFWALDFGDDAGGGGDSGESGGAGSGGHSERGMRERRYELDVAEADGTLYALGSTYSAENDAVYDGLSRPGVRLVSFAQVLKHGLFPLADLLSALLDIGTGGMNRSVEIEFAVRLAARDGEPHEFGFLQLRPLVPSRETDELEIGGEDPAGLVCRSPRVLGNGVVDNLRHVVVVDFHRFDRAGSWDAALAIARFNARLVAEGAPYLLIGVGRWGSADPWLGIPVTWDEISGARVIVEAGFRDYRVAPSQGSHFFQNIVSFQVGYFTTNPQLGDGFVDWEWLAAQPAIAEESHVRLLAFERPLVVRMDGRRNQGVIHKPKEGAGSTVPR
ncbi:MAG: PEP/pyruvate-binding domain-containing protein [Gemmatimonadales bacterium]